MKLHLANADSRTWRVLWPSRQLLRYVGPLHRLKAPTVGALPEASDRRYAGPERRIALHIHVHIATNRGEKFRLYPVSLLSA